MDPRSFFRRLSLRQQTTMACRDVSARCLRILSAGVRSRAATMPRHVARGYLRAQLSGPIRELAQQTHNRQPRLAGAIDAEELAARALDLAVEEAAAASQATRAA